MFTKGDRSCVLVTNRQQSHKFYVLFMRYHITLSVSGVVLQIRFIRLEKA